MLNPRLFCAQKFLDPKLFWLQNYLDPKIFDLDFFGPTGFEQKQQLPQPQF